MESEQTMQKIREVGLREAQNGNAPPELYTELAVEKGIELAKKLNADAQIVETALWLCDSRIRICLRENRVHDHIRESVEFAKIVLKEAVASPSFSQKALQCMEEHHSTKHKFLEGEIVANADAFKFLQPIGLLHLLRGTATHGQSYRDSLKYVREKLEEKWNVLTLPGLKEEMRENYEHLKFVLDAAIEKEAKLNFKVN